MPHLGELMTHLRLVLRMGQVTGTDIVAGAPTGRPDTARLGGHDPILPWVQVGQSMPRLVGSA